MVCNLDLNLSNARAVLLSFFFFQAEDGIRDLTVTGVQTCALPISLAPRRLDRRSGGPARMAGRRAPPRGPSRRPTRRPRPARPRPAGPAALRSARDRKSVV